jgi:hypothetical protein
MRVPCPGVTDRWGRGRFKPTRVTVAPGVTDRKQLVILMDVVSGCVTFSEAPCLVRKCGTRRSDSPVRALYSTMLRLW